MATLKDSPIGLKRILEIESISNWDIVLKMITINFYIDIVDVNNVLIEDKAVQQHRGVLYTLTNDNRVRNGFTPIESGGTGEYDFFINLVKTTPLPTILDQLADKLNERGLFD
tara:strand:+ start:3925 stop:4263 length:339 start_codon:yes stop_codon:yes gene_type:complete